ncbi:helicase-related protein, partial [Micrococcus sp. SIMBA_144]
ANYLAQLFKENLPKSIEIQAITSELPDEERRERINEMGKSEKRILIATDCLSEGINLQKYFNAVLHYDLPWNPNRLEQREGRV